MCESLSLILFAFGNQHICLTYSKDRAAIPAQDTFKYYIFAVNRGRKALAEALLPATMRGDISKVEKSVLCALPASDLYELVRRLVSAASGSSC